LGGLAVTESSASLTTPNGASHAGSQPFDITAAPDRPRTARGKFIVPEKKTGVPNPSPATKPTKKASTKKPTKNP
jgi:excinuclease ABC subunit A